MPRLTLFLAALASSLIGLSPAFAAPAPDICDPDVILQPGRAADDVFGYPLISNRSGITRQVIAAAQGDDTPQGANAGAINVFREVGSIYQHIAKIISPNGSANEGLGHSIAARNLYIAASGKPLGSGGRIVIFKETAPGVFSQTQSLTPPVISDVGYSSGIPPLLTISYDGFWLFVADRSANVDLSPTPGITHPGSGVVLVYKLVNDTWTYHQVLKGAAALGNAATNGVTEFGRSVVHDSQWIYVSAPDADINGSRTGAIVVYKLINDVWTVRTINSAGQSLARTGISMSVDYLNFLAVGAPNYDSTAAQTPTTGALTDVGHVIIYERQANDTLLQVADIFPTDPQANMLFGSDVETTGGRLAATAAGPHRVYVFSNLYDGNNENWAQSYMLDGSGYPLPTTFGFNLGLIDNQLFVGHSFDGGSGFAQAGSVYHYNLYYPYFTDTCAAATSLHPGLYTGCTAFATRTEQTTCGGTQTAQGPDVWCTLIPTCSGAISINTLGSSFDTVLSVHTGCPTGVSVLTNTLVCNDDGYDAPERASNLIFNATAGQTYYIRIAGYGGERGQFKLDIRYFSGAPSNDNCSNAQPIGLGTTPIDNCKAATDGPSDYAGCEEGANVVQDIWFRYTAPASGTLTMSTCGSTFDTELEVFPFGACPTTNTQAIACGEFSNDQCFSASPAAYYTTRLSMPLVAAQTILIRVSGYISPADNIPGAGTGVLTLSIAPTCTCDYNASGSLTVQDIFDFLAGWFAAAPQADFNGVGGISVQDIFDFLSCWFNGCP